MTDDILTDTIELSEPDGYTYIAEEVMYLSGVKLSAYNPGVKYTLYDMDGDTVSELVVSLNDTVGVYSYDETTNRAKRTTEFDSDIDFIMSDESVIWVDDTQWVDGTIYGVAGQIEDPGVKTDYYTSSNYDFLKSVNVPEQGDSTSTMETGTEVEDRKNEMFEDRDKYKGDDIQRVRDFYDVATNWEKRNEEGVEPVRKYFSDIDSISSIDELSDFLADPKRDPFSIFLNFYITLM